MPLSPLLANLALAGFDREVERRRIRMVRYADDLALFFRTKEEANEGRQFITLLLATYKLSIPEIAEGSKTKIISRSDPLNFRTRNCISWLTGYLCSQSRHKAGREDQSPTAKRVFIWRSLLRGKEFSGDDRRPFKNPIAAYLGIYKDAFNYPAFEAELRGLARLIVVKIFQDLFGQEALNSLSPEGRRFLGMGIWDGFEPNPELEV